MDRTHSWRIRNNLIKYLRNTPGLQRYWADEPAPSFRTTLAKKIKIKLLRSAYRSTFLSRDFFVVKKKNENYPNFSREGSGRIRVTRTNPWNLKSLLSRTIPTHEKPNYLLTRLNLTRDSLWTSWPDGSWSVRCPEKYRIKLESHGSPLLFQICGILWMPGVCLPRAFIQKLFFAVPYATVYAFIGQVLPPVSYCELWGRFIPGRWSVWPIDHVVWWEPYDLVVL